MESYNKSVDSNLVTWQYHEYGVWKNFEDNPTCKGDNAVLEQAFQAGKNACTLSHVRNPICSSSCPKYHFNLQLHTHFKQGWYETVRLYLLVVVYPCQRKRRALSYSHFR
jgi:hypothetical protein